MTATPVAYALSIRQPWATLVVRGIKVVEIRTWPTERRGRIYIHAGRLADERSQGWTLVADRWRGDTDLRGGLVGTVDLTGCIAYRSAREFERDRLLHRNDPAWYRPRLFGFVFTNPRPVPFRPLAGQTMFFKVAEA